MSEQKPSPVPSRTRLIVAFVVTHGFALLAGMLIGVPVLIASISLKLGLVVFLAAALLSLIVLIVTIALARTARRKAVITLFLFALGGHLAFWGWLHGMTGVHMHPPGRESKMNLFILHQCLERFHIDLGYYPEWLIGGEYVEPARPPNVDVLLWEGYLQKYSMNEFSIRRKTYYPIDGSPKSRFLRDFIYRRPKWLRAPREAFRELQVNAADKATHDSNTPRFGAAGRYVGNVAADHRYESGKFGLPFWEREAGLSELAIAFQGQFYYKSLKSPGAEKPDGYILMVFGPYDEPGIDAFTTVPGGHDLDGRLPDGTGVGMGVPVIPELGLEGDGKPDGVILVLHGGLPWLAEEWGPAISHNPLIVSPNLTREELQDLIPRGEKVNTSRKLSSFNTDMWKVGIPAGENGWESWQVHFVRAGRLEAARVVYPVSREGRVVEGHQSDLADESLYSGMDAQAVSAALGVEIMPKRVNYDHSPGFERFYVVKGPGITYFNYVDTTTMPHGRVSIGFLHGRLHSLVVMYR